MHVHMWLHNVWVWGVYECVCECKWLWGGKCECMNVSVTREFLNASVHMWLCEYMRLFWQKAGRGVTLLVISLQSSGCENNKIARLVQEAKSTDLESCPLVCSRFLSNWLSWMIKWHYNLPLPSISRFLIYDPWTYHPVIRWQTWEVFWWEIQVSWSVPCLLLWSFHQSSKLVRLSAYQYTTHSLAASLLPCSYFGVMWLFLAKRLWAEVTWLASGPSS